MAFAGAATAGDVALVLPIGYSADQRYFAFEEYGIQDGSGFAYSSVYMIDLGEDHWVVGTPIRIIAEDETQPLAEIRAEAHAGAAPRLKDLGIGLPAHELASIGDGVPDTDGKSLVFGLPAPGRPGEVNGHYELSLSQYTTGSGAPCLEWFGDKALGFIAKLAGYAPAREIHRDEVLPRSRGCPVDYRIHSVYVPFQADSIAGAVALISVFSHGFEGPDRRFIAIPLAREQVGLQ